MNQRHLAAYVLRILAVAQSKGRPMTLASVASALPVRRADLREVVSALHREGLLDVRTLRLTLVGFALGQGLRQKQLPELRPVLSQLSRAA